MPPALFRARPEVVQVKTRRRKPASVMRVVRRWFEMRPLHSLNATVVEYCGNLATRLMDGKQEKWKVMRDEVKVLKEQLKRLQSDAQLHVTKSSQTQTDVDSEVSNVVLTVPPPPPAPVPPVPAAPALSTAVVRSKSKAGSQKNMLPFSANDLMKAKAKLSQSTEKEDTRESAPCANKVSSSRGKPKAAESQQGLPFSVADLKNVKLRPVDRSGEKRARASDDKENLLSNGQTNPFKRSLGGTTSAVGGIHMSLDELRSVKLRKTNPLPEKHFPTETPSPFGKLKAALKKRVAMIFSPISERHSDSEWNDD